MIKCKHERRCHQFFLLMNPPCQDSLWYRWKHRELLRLWPVLRWRYLNPVYQSITNNKAAHSEEECWIGSNPCNLLNCCSFPFIIINQREAGPKSNLEHCRVLHCWVCNKFGEDYIGQYCTLGYCLCQNVMNHSLLVIHSLQSCVRIDAESKQQKMKLIKHENKKTFRNNRDQEAQMLRTYRGTTDFLKHANYKSYFQTSKQFRSTNIMQICIIIYFV